MLSVINGISNNKTGKITVASYMQWRKVMTADYNKFNLIISDEHKVMSKSEYVYNHKGEQLYFRNYNPADVPIFSAPFDLNDVREKHPQYGVRWEINNHINYTMIGTDCDGVPCFSHFTANYIADHYFKKINDFVPLTVEIVSYWYGWFLWQLNNSYISQVKQDCFVCNGKGCASCDGLGYTFRTNINTVK